MEEEGTLIPRKNDTADCLAAWFASSPQLLNIGWVEQIQYISRQIWGYKFKNEHRTQNCQLFVENHCT